MAVCTLVGGPGAAVAWAAVDREEAIGAARVDVAEVSRTVRCVSRVFTRCGRCGRRVGSARKSRACKYCERLSSAVVDGKQLDICCINLMCVSLAGCWGIVRGAASRDG